MPSSTLNVLFCEMVIFHKNVFSFGCKMSVLLLFLNESLTDYFVNDFVLLCNMINMIVEALQDPEFFFKGVRGSRDERFEKCLFLPGLLKPAVHCDHLAPSWHFWLHWSVAGSGTKIVKSQGSLMCGRS